MLTRPRTSSWGRNIAGTQNSSLVQRIRGLLVCDILETPKARFAAETEHWGALFILTERQGEVIGVIGSSVYETFSTGTKLFKEERNIIGQSFM